MSSVSDSTPVADSPREGEVLLVDCTDEQFTADLPLLEKLCAELGMTIRRSTCAPCLGGCNTLRWAGESCEACEIMAAHPEGCLLRLAATCAVPIACEVHGLDVCRECCACTCPAKPLETAPSSGQPL